MTAILRPATTRPSRLATPRVGGPAMCVVGSGAGAEHRKKKQTAQSAAAGPCARGPPPRTPSNLLLPRPPALAHSHPSLSLSHTHSRHPARPVARRAEPENEASPPPSPPGTPPPTPPPAPVKSPREEGSTTALVTGAISVVIGIAYLALVAALNNRGELLPPPPEAFGP